MILNRTDIFILFSLCFLLLFYNCNNKKEEPPLFEILENKITGLDFSNNLSYNPQFNLFKYMYFYNGGGIGAGDFNNDGLIDLFFAGNQVNNKLYLNSGNLKFKDVTEKSAIPQDGGWSTGVSVIDINNDGLLDVYICRVGNYEILKSQNQLLICEKIEGGIPVYKEKAKEYGLNFSGFSTQAAFLDYDMDGDLDMYLLNHSLRYNATFAPRQSFQGTYGELTGDRMYRNDGTVFTDVTKITGINSTIIGYGLGITVADINLDGYPDLYIGNDFHENDYLYINQRNGTFKEEGEQQLMHTSRFSMGVDVADINNDAYPDIISLDMLPSDPYILKKSEGEDAYETFSYKLRFGYNYQYARNNLQLNRRNGMFSEIGLYSGIYATDWSWASLWMDFDNDGLKDLFVANGIPKRMNDIDYINFVSDEAVQLKIRSNNMDEKDMELIDKFPKIKIPNKFYRNAGELVFKDQDKQIKNNKNTYSNGAVFADLDNDADQDIVVSNIDEPAMVYENKTNDLNQQSYLKVKLSGAANNINGIGTKIIVFAKKEIRTYEKYPARGFLSSMEIPMLVGLGTGLVDSVFLIWPDNTFERIPVTANASNISITYKKNLPVFNYALLTSYWQSNSKPMEDITSQVGFQYLHQENTFNEFNREPLIPHMFSTEGPALAIADINHDGLDDAFIGSSKGVKSGIFIQKPDGNFERTPLDILDKDSTYEEVDAAWVDVNNDNNTDLVIASGGNEYYGPDKHLTPVIYLNDGKGHLSGKPDAFDSLYINASCIAPYDFNSDGYMDLFIGARTIPWEYGRIPQSYLLINDKTGRFRDVTTEYAKGLSLAGFVTSAQWFDMDKDGDKDLVLSMEWGGICAFINQGGSFTKKMLTTKKGWWNFILPYDFDNDGDVDLIAGNLGHNSRLRASEKEPVNLYYNDFDGNGKKEQVLTYYLDGRKIPFANKAELEKQLPGMKKSFLYAEDFAKATLLELFSSEKLNKAEMLEADYFSNAILINQGNLTFITQTLPWEAQLTSYKDAIVVNANDDNLPDVLLFGNYYENNIQMGRYDADFGSVLINQGQGLFAVEPINGLVVKGQVRRVRKINIAKKEAYILARNNDSTMIIRFKDQ